MYLREIEMISLDASSSKYYNFFSPYDPLPIAHKKCKDFIGDNYAYFWDSFISNDFESLNDQDFVKLDDLFEIIKFMTPEGIRLFLKNCEFYDKTIFVKKKKELRSLNIGYYLVINHIMLGLFLVGELLKILHQVIIHLKIQIFQFLANGFQNLYLMKILSKIIYSKSSKGTIINKSIHLILKSSQIWKKRNH